MFQLFGGLLLYAPTEAKLNKIQGSIAVCICLLWYDIKLVTSLLCVKAALHRTAFSGNSP